MSIRVLIADDRQLVRAGFALILRPHADLEVIGEASDGAEAVALATQRRPDVILMDIRMPGMDGLEATRRVLADPTLATTQVLILTTSTSTTTSTPRSAPKPAASSSKTRRPNSSWRHPHNRYGRLPPRTYDHAPADRGFITRPAPGARDAPDLQDLHRAANWKSSS